jgi:hypothetical protein
MSRLNIFANFRINSEERFLRMKDSFYSFKEINADKWIVNIRGHFAAEAIQFLVDNLGNKLVHFKLDSKEGWMFDSRTMLLSIDSTYVFNWVEDHINMVDDLSIYDELLEEMEENKIDYMCYSFFAIHKKYSLIPKNETRLLEYFDLNLTNFNLFQEKAPGSYITSAVAILSFNFFRKLICDDDLEQAVVWPKDTPFNLEKSSFDTQWLDFRLANPKFELFCCIDDNHEGDSLIKKGLYPERISRITGAGGVQPLKVAGASDKVRVTFLRIFSKMKPKSILYFGKLSELWVQAAHRYGVNDIIAIDVKGNSNECVRVLPLNRLIDLKKKFDVVICIDLDSQLEVSDSEMLIQNLVNHGSNIVFSASALGQDNMAYGKTHDPAFWQNIFNKYGYVCDDEMRWHLWNDNRIEWKYFNNIFSAKLSKESAGKEKRIFNVLHPQTANELYSLKNGGMPAGWYLKLLTKKVKRKLSIKSK